MRMLRPHRRSVNLTLDTQLVSEARAAGLNISRVSENALRLAVARDRAQRWRAAHAEAIEAYNSEIAERGTFATQLPGWWNPDGAV
jgi:antitoxin CcdA